MANKKQGVCPTPQPKGTKTKNLLKIGLICLVLGVMSLGHVVKVSAMNEDTFLEKVREKGVIDLSKLPTGNWSYYSEVNEVRYSVYNEAEEFWSLIRMNIDEYGYPEGIGWACCIKVPSGRTTCSAPGLAEVGLTTCSDDFVNEALRTLPTIAKPTITFRRKGKKCQEILAGVEAEALIRGLGKGYEGRFVYLKKNTCSGSEISSCRVSADGSCVMTFRAPLALGDYTYSSCIDKNNDRDFEDSGEFDSRILKVSDSLTISLDSSDPHFVKIEGDYSIPSMTVFTSEPVYQGRNFSVFLRFPEFQEVKIVSSTLTIQTFCAECIVKVPGTINVVGVKKSNDGVNYTRLLEETEIDTSCSSCFYPLIVNLDPNAQYYQITARAKGGGDYVADLKIAGNKLKVILEKTCSQLGGTCCSAGQTCPGGTFATSTDCGNLCCVGGTCQTPTPPTPGPTTVSLFQGWNIISSPVEAPLTLSQIESSCSLGTYQGYKVYAYDPRTQTWTHPSEVRKDEGVYVRANDNCTVSLSGTPASFTSKSLLRGWNLISTETTLDQIKGDCRITSDPPIWEWDAQNKQWVHPSLTDRLNQSKGYWIAVENDCTLRTPEEAPPVPFGLWQSVTSLFSSITNWFKGLFK